MKDKINNLTNASSNPKIAAAPAANYATVEELKNEAKLRANGDLANKNNLTTLSRDYQAYKENNDDAVNSKQNKTDNKLTTNDKTIVGAINEIKENIKNVDVSHKQDKTDNSLTTTNKTIVGAINEIQSEENRQSALIEHNTNNINLNAMHINKNTMAITKNNEEIESIKENLKNIDVSQKQDKSDEALTTEDKTIVGAINEVKESIQNIDVSHKQDKSDEALTTEDKTIVGAINEVNSNKVDMEDFTSLQDDFINAQEIINNSLDTKQNKIDSKLLTIDKTIVGAINEIITNGQDIDLSGKQDKSDEALNTEDKDIVGAINEIKANNDEHNKNIEQITSDIESIKENIKDGKLDDKQDKQDEALNTEDKDIVGAINEIKANNDEHNKNIEEITSDIESIKEEYLTKVEAEVKQDKSDEALTTENKTIVGAINEVKESIQNIDVSHKQDQADENLKTENKTIVGAINEIKTTNDEQDKNIKENTTNIEQNTADISKNAEEIQNIKEEYLTKVEVESKQDKSDENLKTENKTIVGAINELKSDTGTLSAFTQQNIVDISKNAASIKTGATKIEINSNDIKNIKETYLTKVEAELKQDKSDEALTTGNKTIVGAINEVKEINDQQSENIKENTTNIGQNTENIGKNVEEIASIKKNIKEVEASKVDLEEFTSLQDDFIHSQEVINNSLDNMQPKRDRGLTTEAKTIVDAINELKARVSEVLPVWKTIGTNIDARTLNFSLVSGKTYQVIYHWSTPSDTTSKIYKQFTWGGKDMVVEAFIDSVSAGITGLGVTGNIAELIATKAGIIIKTKSGKVELGRIIGLQEKN